MATLYNVTGLVPTQTLNEANQLVDVIEGTGVTVPHGVMFTVTVPKVPGWKEHLLAAMRDEATELESVFAA